ncbi:MAG: biopolymer transporter ExbD [Hyphomicrobiales bacterium]
MAILLEPLKTRTRLSLTPLIDVVFLLLLFFMLATQFEKYQSIDLVFPSSNTKEKQSDLKPTIIQLLANEKLIINGILIDHSLSLNQVLNSLNQRNSAAVVLKVGETVPTKRLTKIIDALKNHKISPVTLSN